MGDGGRPLGRRRRRRLLLPLLPLHRMLSCVLARAQPAFCDLRLKLGADISLRAAATARSVLRLGSAPRLLLATATARLLLSAVGAGGLRLPIAAARLLLSA